MVSSLYIILGIIAVIILIIIVMYNSFVRLKNQVENAWAQIDVQLKRRTDLIPKSTTSFNSSLIWSSE